MFVRMFCMLLCIYLLSAHPAPKPQEEQNGDTATNPDLSTEDSLAEESVTEDPSQEPVTEEQSEDSGIEGQESLPDNQPETENQEPPNNPADGENQDSDSDNQVSSADETNTDEEKPESDDENQDKPATKPNEEDNDEAVIPGELPSASNEPESSDDDSLNKKTLSFIMAFWKFAKVTSVESKNLKSICQAIMVHGVTVEERCQNFKKDEENRAFPIQEFVIVDPKIINGQKYICQEIIRPNYGPIQEACIGYGGWLFNPIPVEDHDYFGLFIH